MLVPHCQQSAIINQKRMDIGAWQSGQAHINTPPFSQSCPAVSPEGIGSDASPDWNLAAYGVSAGSSNGSDESRPLTLQPVPHDASPVVAHQHDRFVVFVRQRFDRDDDVVDGGFERRERDPREVRGCVVGMVAWEWNRDASVPGVGQRGDLGGPHEGRVRPAVDEDAREALG